MKARKILKKVRNTVLLLVTTLAYYIMLISFIALAQESHVALITLVISCGWLWLFIKANKEVLA